MTLVGLKSFIEEVKKKPTARLRDEAVTLAGISLVRTFDKHNRERTEVYIMPYHLVFQVEDDSIEVNIDYSHNDGFERNEVAFDMLTETLLKTVRDETIARARMENILMYKLLTQQASCNFPAFQWQLPIEDVRRVQSKILRDAIESDVIDIDTLPTELISLHTKNNCIDILYIFVSKDVADFTNSLQIAEDIQRAVYRLGKRVFQASSIGEGEANSKIARVCGFSEHESHYRLSNSPIAKFDSDAAIFFAHEQLMHRCEETSNSTIVVLLGNGIDEPLVNRPLWLLTNFLDNKSNGDKTAIVYNSDTLLPHFRQEGYTQMDFTYKYERVKGSFSKLLEKLHEWF